MGLESILGSVAAPIVGSLLGAGEGSKGNSQTSQATIDPRIAKYIYGEDGTKGIAPAAYDWWQKNQSGLNPQMQEGLNRQWNVYSDPNTAQGYTNMQQLGSNLMGAPVAGNPFTYGRSGLLTQSAQGGNTGGGAGLLGAQATPQPAGLLGTASQPAGLQFQNPATMTAAPGAPAQAQPVATPDAADPMQAGMEAFMAGNNPMAKIFRAARANGYGLPGSAQAQGQNPAWLAGMFGDGSASGGAGSRGGGSDAPGMSA